MTKLKSRLLVRFSRSKSYIEKMLENGLREFKHRTSEPDAIASWISHALEGIGTKEAFSIIEKYAESEDPFISKAMNYRMERMREKGALQT